MEVIILETSEEVAQLAANRIQNQLAKKANSVLGLATGSTPIKMYNELVRRHQEELIDFSKVTTFNLDEYVGVKPDDPGSYAYYMEENLFSKINMKSANAFIPNGAASDIEAECLRFENAIKNKGPIDIQILGIGRDGHIGFNEPISSLASRTRLKTLTEATRKDNSKFFTNGEVPHHVITMGVGTILEAREIILMATGAAKAQAIAQTVEGPVAAMVPASALQYHNKVKLIIDQEAASKLQNTQYYNWVYSKKPDWQRKELN